MQLAETLQPQRHYLEVVTSMRAPSSRGPPMDVGRAQSVAG